MEITTSLKKRFCKDYNIPIKLYREPYFTERLDLFQNQFQAKDKWDIFINEIQQFKDEQSYYTYYNKVKDNFINNIKLKSEYKEFNSFNMNEYSIPNYGVGRKSVFKESNIAKRLISVDLSKANYNAMKFFNDELVDNTNDYNELIGKFTDLKHIKESKYIRQVVFGNCNPKRQTTIEKYMMNFIMVELLKYIDIEAVQTYMSDEIIFEYKDNLAISLEELFNKLNSVAKTNGFKIHFEDYILCKIPNSDIYVKKLTNGEVDFKCVDALFYPILLRKYQGQPVRDSDLIYFHEGYLSKFIEIPNIEII